MKLAKRIIKWGMIGVPVLVLVIGYVMVTSNPLIDPFDIGIISGQLAVVWLIFSLMALGIVKLIERARHESQTK